MVLGLWNSHEPVGTRPFQKPNCRFSLIGSIRAFTLSDKGIDAEASTESTDGTPGAKPASNPAEAAAKRVKLTLALIPWVDHANYANPNDANGALPAALPSALHQVLTLCEKRGSCPNSPCH